MHKFDEIDDYMLGAFVDGQLDRANCELIIEAMEVDPDIRERVYKLRRAKDLMQLGFASARVPTQPLAKVHNKRWNLGLWGLAASVLLVVVLASAGYFGYHGGRQLAGGSQYAVAPTEQRVLLHISESDPKQFAAALAYTKAFLERHKHSSGQVAVIANTGGLDLLRQGVSPLEDQIVAMIRDYDNVHFLACANSIRALRQKGIEPVIIEKIDSSLPAMDQIIRHVQQGWRYIKVQSLMNQWSLVY